MVLHRVQVLIKIHGFLFISGTGDFSYPCKLLDVRENESEMIRPRGRSHLSYPLLSDLAQGCGVILVSEEREPDRNRTKGEMF